MLTQLLKLDKQPKKKENQMEICPAIRATQD